MSRELPLAPRLELVRMISQRLERLSADSRWAHISSGYRGSMIKLVDSLEGEGEASEEDRRRLEHLIDKGLEFLTNAARDMGDPSLISGLPQR